MFKRDLSVNRIMKNAKGESFFCPYGLVGAAYQIPDAQTLEAIQKALSFDKQGNSLGEPKIEGFSLTQIASAEVLLFFMTVPLLMKPGSGHWAITVLLSSLFLVPVVLIAFFGRDCLFGLKNIISHYKLQPICLPFRDRLLFQCSRSLPDWRKSLFQIIIAPVIIGWCFFELPELMNSAKKLDMPAFRFITLSLYAWIGLWRCWEAIIYPIIKQLFFNKSKSE